MLKAAQTRKGTTVLQLAEDSLRRLETPLFTWLRREKETRKLLPQSSLVCPLELDHDDDEGDESQGPIMTSKYSYKMGEKKAAPASPSDKSGDPTRRPEWERI